MTHPSLSNVNTVQCSCLRRSSVRTATSILFFFTSPCDQPATEPF